MGRPRKWKNDAERMAAKRASQKRVPGKFTEGDQEVSPEVAEALDRDLAAAYDELGLENPDKPVVQQDALELALSRSPEVLGRRYGEDTADRLGETGEKRETRIRQAISYQRFVQDPELREPG